MDRYASEIDVRAQRPCGVEAMPFPTPTLPERPLDRISNHANTAGRIGDLIEQFIDRFRNGPEEPDIGVVNTDRAPVGHAEQLDRLEKNLARAEELARNLNTLG